MVQKQDYRVTSPYRTILNIVADTTLEENIIKQVVTQFRAKSMLLKKQIYQIIEEHPKSARYFLEVVQKVSGI